MAGFVPAPSLSLGSVVAHEVDDYAGSQRTPAQRPKHHVDHWNGLVLERSIRLQAKAENYISQQLDGSASHAMHDGMK